MYHKISQFCDKIDSIKTQADRLRELKYNQPKSDERDFMIDNLNTNQYGILHTGMIGNIIAGGIFFFE